jgi:hypothetical protein
MKKQLFTLIFVLAAIAMQAQSIERWAISSSGGSYYDGTSFEMDYTAGEVIVTTLSNGTNFLTQGFQQPFTNSTVSVPENADENSNIQFYPNPVEDHLVISIQNAKSGVYRYQVYDLLGQLLSDETLTQSSNGDLLIKVDFQKYATGNYFLRLLHDNELINSGKIIKVNQ